MKHLVDTSHSSVTQHLEAMNIPVAPDALAIMLKHLDFVIETNQSINLTAITDPDEALRLHLID